MPRNGSKERIGKDIPGTNKVATKGDPLQMRKIRCPACQKVATVQQSPEGKIVAVCICGRSFSSRPF